MRVISLTVKEMERVSLNLLMVTTTMDHGKMVKSTVMVHILMLMVTPMKANLPKERRMVEVPTNGAKVRSMTATGRMTVCTVKENSLSLMVLSKRESLRIINL